MVRTFTHKHIFNSTHSRQLFCHIPNISLLSLCVTNSKSNSISIFRQQPTHTHTHMYIGHDSLLFSLFLPINQLENKVKRARDNYNWPITSSRICGSNQCNHVWSLSSLLFACLSLSQSISKWLHLFSSFHFLFLGILTLAPDLCVPLNHNVIWIIDF